MICSLPDLLYEPQNAEGRGIFRPSKLISFCFTQPMSLFHRNEWGPDPESVCSFLLQGLWLQQMLAKFDLQQQREILLLFFLFLSEALVSASFSPGSTTTSGPSSQSSSTLPRPTVPMSPRNSLLKRRQRKKEHKSSRKPQNLCLSEL